MLFFESLSPLANFIQMIAVYLAEIWDFLIFIGTASSAIVVLAGAILWHTDVNQTKGKALVLSGIILAVVIEYFVMFPPEFVLS